MKNATVRQGVFACLAISWLLLDPISIHARTIVAATAPQTAVPGTGFKAEKESFSGACISGTIVETGAQTSSFSLDQALSEKQASDELGFGAGGRAQYGAVEASMSARFLRNSVSNKYSVSSVWSSNYLFPTKKLTTPTYSEVGNAVKANFERWATTCGDEFVEEVVQGAKLFFSIRVDFTSEEQKQKFEASFSISGPMFSANADLNKASRDFSREAKVTVSALQVGGDVSKITKIFPDSPEGRAGFVECTLGDFKKCSEVLVAAIAYASDTTSGFPAQLAPGAKPGPADLEYRTASYSVAGIYPTNYPGLQEVTILARERLQRTFEQTFVNLILADRLLAFGMGEKREAVIMQRNLLDANMSRILAVQRICYETPENCFENERKLRGDLVGIDTSVFILPPPLVGSYRLLTTSKGVWSRAASVNTMKPDKQSICSIKNDSVVRAGGLGVIDRVRIPTNLSLVAPAEGASVVLYVEGIGIRDAVAYFEGTNIGPIPLTGDTLRDQGKVGERFAAIVVKTTRNNPGWLDLDMSKFRKRVWANEIPVGDGTFYLVVHDAFGRASRFDVEYQKWGRYLDTRSEPPKVISEDYLARNRWWDPSSPGVSLAGEGNWSFHFANEDKYQICPPGNLTITSPPLSVQ